MMDNVSIGERFGALMVVGQARAIDAGPRAVCRCDCGEHIIILELMLRHGRARSCGCSSKCEGCRSFPNIGAHRCRFGTPCDENGVCGFDPQTLPDFALRIPRLAIAQD